MSVKAVISDLDGTLLNPAHRVSEHTLKTIKLLKAKGIFFVVATGRPFGDVFATLDNCKLEPDYIISSNGARIHDGKTRKVLVEHNIDPNVVREMVRIMAPPPSDGADAASVFPEAKKFSTNLYRDAEWITDRATDASKAMFQNGFTYTEISDRLYELDGEELEGVHEIWFMGSHEDLTPIQEIVQAKHNDGVCAVFSLPTNMDCVKVGINKGEAVKQVAQLLDITVDEVACFGDGMNDEAMLRVAGKAYIMSNASQKLKDALPTAEVIGCNSKDGVARKIEELFL